jgi:hypothetical protein
MIFLSIGSQQHAQAGHTHFKTSSFNKLMKLEPWSQKDPTYSSLSPTLHPKLQLNNKLKAQVENGFGFYLWICIGMWTCETIHNDHREKAWIRRHMFSFNMHLSIDVILFLQSIHWNKPFYDVLWNKKKGTLLCQLYKWKDTRKN